MRAALLLLLLAPAAAAADRKPAATPDPRTELRVLELALARAADGVARPSALALGAPECRGYRIDGMGAVFVLAPRALRSSNVLFWRRPLGAHDRELRIAERQAEELQREAARTHAEVERAMAEMQRELEWRLQGDSRPARAAASAPPASPPPAATALPVPPPPPEAPLPPAPPWALWFDSGDAEESEAPTEVVVERMRDALAGALEDHGLALEGLRPEETIAAAVDFVPSFRFDGVRAEKTLVLRVKKRDLQEGKVGRIGPDQLRARIEVVEY